MATAFVALALPPAFAQSATPEAAALCEKTAAPKGADETEKRVWRSICLAGHADLSALDDKGCDAVGPVQWPIERKISAGFLKAIYFDEPWRSARRAGALHLRCAVIDGDLDLSHRSLPDALLIEESRLTGVVSLLDAVAERQLSFRGSRLAGALDAEGLRAEADVFLRAGFFEQPVRLRGARLSGALEAQGAILHAGLSLKEARVEGPLSLASAQLLGGQADFAGLRAPSLDMTGADLLRAESVSLRAADLGAFDASLQNWPAKIDLRGLKAEGGGYLAAGPRALIAWLESGFAPNGGFAEERTAYLALASAQSAAGRDGDARETLIAERRRFLERGQARGLSAALWRLWGWTASFGHKPEKALVWLAALIALGVGLAASSPSLRRLGAARLLRLSAENAVFWPGGGAERGRLYRAAAPTAALFALQRLAGAALLAAAVFSLLTRFTG